MVSAIELKIAKLAQRWPSVKRPFGYVASKKATNTRGFAVRHAALVVDGPKKR